MKQNRISYLLLSSFLVVIVCGMFIVSIQANAEGGAVQTNGEITFYDETTGSTTEPTTEPTIDSSTSYPKTSGDDSGTRIEKPVGKYPSTGELVQKSLSISGIVLIAVGIIFFVLKKRKKEAE